LASETVSSVSRVSGRTPRSLAMIRIRFASSCGPFLSGVKFLQHSFFPRCIHSPPPPLFVLSSLARTEAKRGEARVGGALPSHSGCRSFVQPHLHGGGVIKAAMRPNLATFCASRVKCSARKPPRLQNFNIPELDACLYCRFEKGEAMTEKDA